MHDISLSEEANDYIELSVMNDGNWLSLPERRYLRYKEIFDETDIIDNVKEVIIARAFYLTKFFSSSLSNAQMTISRTVEHSFRKLQIFFGKEIISYLNE